MSAQTVGLLHPGAMGSTIGRSIQCGGHRILWASQGRSRETRERAEVEGFEEIAALVDLCAQSDVVVSVCPPHAAAQLAEQVAGTGYGGVYVDANAIPPALAGRIGELIVGAGGGYVDGSIIGPPARASGSTRVYLSGTGAASVAELFDAGAADAVVLDGFLTSASALKMVYAAYTKGSAALLLAVLGGARSLRVDEALRLEWAMSIPELPARSDRLLEYSGRKAWRFEGEMRFISETFESAGLPGGFHSAAAEIYRRLGGQADESFPVAHEQTLTDLLAGTEPAPFDPTR